MFRSAIISAMPDDKWLSMLEFQQIHPDSKQSHWLSELGSMTKRFLDVGNVHLQVKVISSAYQKPTQEERLFLNLRQRRTAYVREVIMHVDDQPWMFGRTIIPEVTLKGAGGQLKLLGEKPLGQVLFKNKLNLRSFIEIAKISQRHFLYPKSLVSDDDHSLWARRSLFHFQNSPLLVQEVFLPNCPLE